MHAIIETGGKQYRVAAGDTLRVEKLDAEVGAQLRFTRVLAIGDGADAKFGTPTVDGAAVTAEVVAQDRHSKVIVFKHKRRKGHRKKTGHRQPFTELTITGIDAG